MPGGKALSSFSGGCREPRSSVSGSAAAERSVISAVSVGVTAAALGKEAPGHPTDSTQLPLERVVSLLKLSSWGWQKA